MGVFLIAYDKECKTCGAIIRIDNETRRAVPLGYTVGSPSDQKMELEDINGNNIIKADIHVTLGRVHDLSKWFCSEKCYKKYKVAEKL